MKQIASSQALAYAIVNENFDTLSHQAVYGKNQETTTGLTWGHYGGRWGGFSVADGTLSLTASSANYVVVAIATGVISVSTASTNWDNATDYVRVYKITTGTTSVSSVEDHRVGPRGVHGGSSSGGTTSVANGGTGRTSHTAYAVLCGGTTSTSAQQSVAAVGTAGQVLTSNGAGALPTFQSPAGGSQQQHIAIACSDETTALTAGTAKATFRMPYAFTLTEVRASLTTAATGATLFTVDINEGGVSILSTKLTFDASEKTTTTAATPAVISDTSLADDAEITIDIDSVGNTVAGAGLKVYLIGSPT